MTHPNPTQEGQLRYAGSDDFLDIAAFFLIRKDRAHLVPCRCSPSCNRPCLGQLRLPGTRFAFRDRGAGEGQLPLEALRAERALEGREGFKG